MKIKYFKEKKGRMAAVLNAGQMRLLDWMLQRQRDRIMVPDVGMIYSNVWFLCNPPGTGKTRVLVVYIQETKGENMSSLIITCKTKIHRWIKELVASECSYEVLHKRDNFNDSWYPCTTVVLITAASYNNFMMKCGHRIKWKHVMYEYPLMYYIRNMCTPTTCTLWIITPNPRFLLHHRFPRKHFLFTVCQRLNDQLIGWISVRNLFHDIRKNLMYDPIHRYIYMNPSFHIILYARENCLTRSYTNTDDLYSIWQSKDKIFRMSTDESSCIICFNETISTWLQTPCCFKIICDECSVKWFGFKPQCPNCRTTLNDVREFLFFHRMNDDTLRIFDIPHTDWKTFIQSGLKHYKTVVFTSSEYDTTKHTLTRSNHGKLISEFRSSDLPSYVIVPHKKWMMGQEIPECSDLVFIDEEKKTRWSMEDKIYFIGRAQRIGRSAPLTVHHIII